VILRMNVLPVGRSLLTSVEDKAELAGLRGVLELQGPDDPGNPSRSVHVELERLTDPTTRVLDLHRVLSSEDEWAVVLGATTDACAEWTATEVPDPPGWAGPNGHSYVLIASDTNDGLRSAVLTAARYTANRTMRYVAEPTAAPDREIEPGEVVLYRIPGLNLARGDLPDQVWFSLGAVGHTIQRTATDATAGRWDVVLHLTGGYKAMLPYLLVMAEGIKSVFEDHDEVSDPLPTIRGVTVHQDNVDTQVELPIRWISRDWRQELLALKQCVGNGSAVPSDRWNGWKGQWLEAAENPRRLSRSGMILVRVQ
jgi:hypothetical protein